MRKSMLLCLVAPVCITMASIGRIRKLIGLREVRRWGNPVYLLLLTLLSASFSIGQTYGATLSVVVSGSGHGSVNSSPSGITCPGTCSGTFTDFTLYQNSMTDSIFTGWGGACGGMEYCALTLSSDMTVQAFFELKHTQMTVSGSNYGAIQEAYNDVASGGKVLVAARDQTGDLTLDKAVDFTLVGGFDDAFSSNAGNSTKLHGTVSIRAGSLRASNLLLVSSVQTMPPPAPSGLTATAGDGQAVVSWNDVLGATSYNVYYSTSSAVSRANGTKVAGAIKGDAVSGLTNGVTYYLVVTAADASGEGVESSPVIITPFNAAAPSAPDVVTASAGSSQVEVGWVDVAGATYYSVYWSTSPGVTTATGTKISPIAASPYQHTGLTNATTYYYIVTANIGATESAASPEASAKPAAAAVNPRLLKRTVYAVTGGKTPKTTKTITLYAYDATSGYKSHEYNYTYAETELFTGSIAYEYDADGKETKRSYYDINNTLFRYTATTYNPQGNKLLIASYFVYDVFAILQDAISNEYDLATGELLLKVSIINAAGQTTAYTTNEYNAAGSLTKKSSYKVGELQDYTEYEYREYNGKEYEIMRSSYNGFSGLINMIVKIEHEVANDKLRVIRETTYNGLTGLMTKYSTCEYNADNKLIKASNYDFANNPTGYGVLIYNTAGKMTMTTTYAATGEVTARTTDEYGY